MKRRISGIVHNISTNPFSTFSRKGAAQSSALLSFDISFDLVDDDAQITHVWFNRSFRLPPKLEDGDHIEVVGRNGLLWGAIRRKNFYAIRIVDKRRDKEYTPWRTRNMAPDAEQR